MDEQQRAEQLLDEFINRMDITWATDEDVRKKLLGIMVGCMDDLADISSNPALQFTGWVKSLLFDYCRYDYNDNREGFKAAFLPELTRLRLREELKRGTAAETDL